MTDVAICPVLCELDLMQMTSMGEPAHFAEHVMQHLQAVTAGDDKALKAVPVEAYSSASEHPGARSSAFYTAVCQSSPQAFFVIRISCMQAVTAGDDGALKVVPLEGSAAPQSIMEPRSSASYAAVRWSSPEVFVTAGTTGMASW